VGTSFTRYRGKGFWTRDGQIAVWLYLLVEEIDRLENPAEWLRQLREDWLFQATIGASGCVGAGLDEWATSEERVRALVELSRKALDRLRERGRRLTLEVPYAHGTGGPDTLCIDRDIRIFSCVGEAFIDLLEGRVTTDARTAPCLWPPEVPYV
jgi:hypothetical protein